MTSSEQTDLDPGVLEELAGEVGTSVTGDHDGRGLRVALAGARFNGGISERLVRGALDALAECAVDRADITLAWVPGAFELPLVARAFAAAGRVDAVVCLGAVIRGETGHYEQVAGQCAAGIARVQLDTGLPVVFGVLTTETVDQALARSLPDPSNKGREAAITAVEMVRLLATGPLTDRSLAARRSSVMI
jgi:6,7-dimethyl-8-ribityllumazine synthase